MSYLLPLSQRDFDRIPESAVPRTRRLEDPTLESDNCISWIMSGYYHKLIGKNTRLADLLTKYVNRMDEPNIRDSLTTGQRILNALTALDGQVNNGGISQFFWNCPDLIFEARDASLSLRLTELHDLYQKAVQRLLAKLDGWIELRKQWIMNPADAKWDAFADSYELLQLDWFTDTYFTRLGALLRRTLVDYVKSHKYEFIEAPL